MWHPKRRLVVAIITLSLAARATQCFQTTFSWSPFNYAVGSSSSLLLAKKSGKGGGIRSSKSPAARRSANGGGGAGFGGISTTTSTKPSIDPSDKVNNHGRTPPPGIVVEAVVSGHKKSARGINKWKNRSARDDDDEDSKRTSTRAKEEEDDPVLSGCMAGQETKKKRLVQVSTHPLVFTVDDFIDPVLCERIGNDGGGCFDLMFPERVADLLFDGQESELDGLLFNTDSSQNHDPNGGPYPHGVHMDTNGQVLFRHVTCILYLNTVPIECGGATVFPLARCRTDDDVALAGSRLLLAEKISHTRSPAVGTAIPGAAAAVRAIEGRVHDDLSARRHDPNTDAATALRIQPQAGRLLVFFSRDEHGAEDPRAWHAGERLRSSFPPSNVVVEKRILTLFKQVDYGTVHNIPRRAQTTFEEYLAPQIQRQQQSLKVKAQLGLPIEYGGGMTAATNTAAASD